MKPTHVLGIALLAFSSLAAYSQAVGSSLTNPTSISPTLTANYGKLPLSFEANQGQTDRQVRFLSRGDGYSLFLTGSEAVLTLRRPEKIDPNAGYRAWNGKAGNRRMPPFKTDVVRMQLAGASAGVRVRGDDRLPEIANYFIGNDPKKWHSKVPTYGKVKYAGIYPGVDLVYYGNQRQLEYDFVVAPGADPKPIRLHFAGTKKISLTRDGNLQVKAKHGDIAFHKPVAYQEFAGERRPVEGRFKMLSKNTVGFSLGNYDHARQVVIDPTLIYSTYLGGSGKLHDGDVSRTIAADASGNAYIAGYTWSPHFPTTPGAYQEDYPNSQNANVSAFVTKLNASGDALVYSTYLGGSEDPGDGASGIAVDASGDAYVVGYTFANDFPIKNAFQPANNDYGHGSNVFITKLDPSGSDLIFSTYLGGSGGGAGIQNDGDIGEGIALDSSGAAYITGLTNSAKTTSSTTFPITPGAYQTVNKAAANGGWTAFVAKLSGSGALDYCTFLGGSTDDIGYSTATDALNNAYVIGITLSTDFPYVPGSFQEHNKAANGTAFVTKLDPTGTSLVYSTYLGGSSSEIGYGIQVDSLGNAYVAGSTSSHDFPVTPGSFQQQNRIALTGFNNCFITKLNAAGTGLIYSTYVGGSGNTDGGDRALAIAIDSSGNAYITGYTVSEDFPVTPDAYQPENHGWQNAETNAFLFELNPAGTAPVYSTYLGGTGDVSANIFDTFVAGDLGFGIAVDGSRNVYLTGYSYSSDFPAFNALQTSNNAFANDASNAFIAKFQFTSATSPALQFIPVTPCRIVDTRWPSGPFGGPEMGTGATRSFDIPQSTCGIPSTAVAYSLNATVVPDGFLSYLTLWPTGEAQPYVSTLNSDGRVKANAAIVPAGTNGGVSVYVSNPTQVILDIDGYFVPAGTTSALAFYPVTPCRVVDTEWPTGPLGGPSISAGGSRSFPVTSSGCGIPSTAQAYSLNITAVPHSTLGYLTAWATGQTQPYVSTLNSSTGTVVANAAIVPASTSGDVSIFVSDAADVILDINGYFAPPGSGGLSLYTVPPCRVIDTRPTAFTGTTVVNVEGSTCAPPSTAQAYVLNATVVPPGSLGYLTLWPDGEAQPYVSTLNALDGAITSNMAIVPTNNGKIDAYASNPTNLILDLSSYFAP